MSLNACEHPLLDVRYRVTNVSDGDWPPRETYTTSEMRTDWTCARPQCILDTVSWVRSEDSMVFMYTRKHKPITFEEAMKGAK